MKVYTVLWQDRHSDPSVIVFDTAEPAIAFAKAAAHKYARGYEVDETPVSDWLYHGVYGEGCSLTVCRSPLNPTFPP